MLELMKTVDNWFLILAVFIFGSYFLWSIHRLFMGLQQSIEELKKLITDLFEHRNGHETRITALETRCKLICERENHRKD